MDKITVKTKLDFKTLKYCNLFIMKFKKKAVLWFVITAVLAAGLAIYDIFFAETANYMFAILGGIFIAYSLYQYLNMENKLDKQLITFFSNRPFATITIEVEDDKIVVFREYDNNPIEYDWSFITEICEMPQYYMLMAGKGSPVIIDRSEEALLSGTKEALDTLIKAKANMKPYKVTDQNIVKNPITFVHPEFPHVMSEEDVVEAEVSEEAEATVDLIEQESEATVDMVEQEAEKNEE